MGVAFGDDLGVATGNLPKGVNYLQLELTSQFQPLYEDDYYN